MRSPVRADGTSARAVGVQVDKQLQQEDGDKVVRVQVTKDMMPQIIALQRYVMERANEQKDSSGTNTEEPGETVTHRRVKNS